MPLIHLKITLYTSYKHTIKYYYYFFQFLEFCSGIKYELIKKRGPTATGRLPAGHTTTQHIVYNVISGGNRLTRNETVITLESSPTSKI